MSVHLLYNPQTSTHGKYVVQAVAGLENGKRALAKAIGVLGLMIDNAGTQDADYATMATRIGASDGASARKIWDELNSANAKITTDASVTSVNAALEQLFNKLAI